ncbi:uncharacterized protein M6B38_142535 [Iris pallida]|uniref:Uncharacterized protein n=1 Tax=Iris pallida TaxID=29817 RepID=A0AAX6FCH5_IRIPA|nr:uncharacterized protein M6B38_142535 [Iris pallida]
MSRRPVRSFTLSGSVHKKSRSSPLLSVGLVLLGAFLLIGYSYRNSGGEGGGGAVSRKELSGISGGGSCTLDVQQAIPALKAAYGESMSKVLHVGPETCSVVSKFLKEDIEALGVEPYDLEEADSGCKSLVRKGIVRVADIKFPLPYREKSFSLVIVSDALDYLSPKYVNKTLLDLTRVSTDGLVVFTGYPGQQKVTAADQSKFGRLAKLRSPSWWVKYFAQTGLEVNEDFAKKFEKASSKQSYKPNCQIFHLSS